MDDLDMFHGGQAIRNRRLKLTLSIDELADRVSIHPRELTEYENNECGIPDRHFRKLAIAFNLPAHELAWECLAAAIPGFQNTKDGRLLRSLSKDITKALKFENNGHVNGKPKKTIAKTSNKRRVPA